MYGEEKGVCDLVGLGGEGGVTQWGGYTDTRVALEGGVGGWASGSAVWDV